MDPRLSHERTKALFSMLEKARDLHVELLSGLLALTEDIKAKRLLRADLADAGYICREIGRLCDEIRKEAAARESLAGAILSAIYTQETLNNPSVSDVIRGNICRAKVDMVMEASLPAEGTPEYEQFLDHIGLPESLRKICKPSWKKLSQMITELASEGKPLPPGIGKSWPRYFAVFTKV